MSFSQRLKELRAEKGITQQQLSAITGLSLGCISMLEVDKRAPTGSTLVALADVFGCTTDYLLGREDELGNVTVYQTTDNVNTLSANEQRIVNLIRKNPPHNATEWIELYSQMPLYMQESIFAELKGMHIGYMAAKARKEKMEKS